MNKPDPDEVCPISGEKLSENYDEIYKFKAYRQIMKNQAAEQAEMEKKAKFLKKGKESDDDSIDVWKDDAENALEKKKKALKRKREEEKWEIERKRLADRKRIREEAMAKIENYYEFPAYSL